LKESIRIADREVGAGSSCFVIAEIGANHDGKMEKAKKLILAAAVAGADAVKFQTFKATDIVNPTLPANYDPQEPVPDKFNYFFEYIEQFELPFEWHDELIEFCRDQGLIFISTPCSVEAVHFLSSRIQVFKVASMDLTNKELLEEVGKQAKPVILSTGIGDMGEIERAIMTLDENGTSDVVLLHCVSNYPSRPEELNLRNIPMLRDAFDCPVGFSDHSLGINSSLAAVALCACVIEKHITLNRKTPGPDHFFALEPDELKSLVSGIREVELAMGSSQRIVTSEECQKRRTFRRSLLNNKPLKAGYIIRREDIAIIRPGDGISPFDFGKIVGMELKRDLDIYTPLRWDHFKD